MKTLNDAQKAQKVVFQLTIEDFMTVAEDNNMNIEFTDEVIDKIMNGFNIHDWNEYVGVALDYISEQ